MVFYGIISLSLGNEIHLKGDTNLDKIIRDEEKYYDEMWFAYSLDEFIKVNSPNRWWFKDCTTNGDNAYFVTFKSYITPEYSNFELNVRVKVLPDRTYSFEIVREVTELT
jgi:hypothetical protein